MTEEEKKEILDIVSECAMTCDSDYSDALVEGALKRVEELLEK